MVTGRCLFERLNRMPEQLDRVEILKQIEKQYCFDRKKTLETLRLMLLLKPQLLRVASGYFRVQGLDHLLMFTLAPFNLHLLVGFEDEEVIVEKIKPVLERIDYTAGAGPADEFRTAAVALLNGIKSGRFIIKDFQARYQPLLHGKLYIADEYAALPASTNFTHNGFKRNIEVSHPVTELSGSEAMEYYLKMFDAWFEQAKDITPEVEQILERHLNQEPLTPYQFYQLCLHHLYPQLNDKSARQIKKYALSPYQSDMVMMSLRTLQEYRRVLVVSPTGTGKTVIGCRIAYEMRLRGLINRVVVVCPAALTTKWEDHLIDFHFSPEVYSMEMVGRASQFDSESRLTRVFASLDNETLVMIDESQHFRNLKKAGGYVNRVLQMLRLQARARPYSVGFTATPYSRSWKDLETQLSVIGVNADKIRKPEDLRGYPFLHITLPFIFQNYAHKDEYGAYLEFGQKRRRFANIDIKAQQVFEYPFKETIEILEQFSLVSPHPMLLHKAKASPMALQLGLFTQAEIVLNTDDADDLESDDDIVSNTEDGFDVRNDFEEDEWRLEDDEDIPRGWVRSRLHAANLLKLALSSPPAFLSTIQTHLENLPKYKNILNRQQVKEWLERLEDLAQQAVVAPDKKLEKLLALCQTIPQHEKVLIFCESTVTAGYLKKRLEEVRPSVEKIIGGTSDKRKQAVISCFAPVSNFKTKWTEGETEFNTLVATDCISEGLDFQDAKYLINYDLPWTPLTLVQRLGRLDRPGDEDREFIVYNFAPPTDVSEMVLRFLTTLDSRSKIYKSMSKINLLEKERRTVEGMRKSDAGFISLFLKDNLTINDLRGWMEKLPTTDHLTELAKLTPAVRNNLAQLPPRARSAMKAKDKKGYFILLKHKDNYHIVFTDSYGEPYPEEHFLKTTQEKINLIACDEDEPLQPLPDPATFDAIVSKALKDWAARGKINPDEVIEIGTEALV